MFITAEAAPAIWGFTLRMATVASGANVQPSPSPAISVPGRKVNQSELIQALASMIVIPTANRLSPNMTMYFPPIRSARRPAFGATTIETSDIGTNVRPALIAVKPSADCR